MGCPQREATGPAQRKVGGESHSRRHFFELGALHVQGLFVFLLVLVPRRPVAVVDFVRNAALLLALQKRHATQGKRMNHEKTELAGEGHN